MEPIYLDYNASTPIAPEAAEAMRPLLSEHFGNPSSGHWAGVPAKAALEQARTQIGASARRSGLGGVWGAEIGYYDSRDDRAGTNPAIENSQFRFLLTYQRQLAEDFTGSIEYYGEQMQDYAAYRRRVPAGFPTRAELRDLVGVRLTKLLRYQTLKLSLFTFYSPRARDFLMSPEISYNFSDGLWAAVGGNIFGGPSSSFFGQFGRNDNAYLSVRYSY